MLVLGSVVVGVAVASAGAALAHTSDASVVAELRTIQPEPPAGVTVQVVNTVAAQVVAENTTAKDLVVLATGGEPVLRLGPRGVHANVASPDWYQINDPSGAAPVPPRARTGGAKPDWRPVSARPSWGWFDHRLHEEPVRAPAADGQPRVLASWEIPMRYGTSDLAVQGAVIHRPIQGSVVATLDQEPTPPQGLTLTVLPGALPGLFLTSDRRDDVLVRGAAGEPFLRVGPSGAHVNVRSPTWAQTASARGRVPPALVDPDAPPRWKRLSDAPRVGWLEPRTVPEADPSAEVTSGGRAVELTRWTIPLDVAGEAIELRGVTRWEPLRTTNGEGGDDSPRSTAGGLAVLAAALVLVAAAWRRRTSSR